MTNKKTILEDAILDIKNIQKALNENTKEILRSVAYEEIDGVVKESLLKEDEFEEEEIDADEVGPEPTFGDADALAGGDDSIEDNGLAGLGDTSDEAPEGDVELGMDPLGLGSEVDLTSASDEDVVQIFKKLSGEDEVEIVGDDIHLTVSEPGEYVIKTNSIGDTEEETMVDDLADLDGEDDSVEYEIEMDDDMDDVDAESGEETDEIPDDLEAIASDEEGETEEPAGEESEEEEDVEIDEQIRTNQAAAMKAGAEYQPKVLGAKQIAESESKKLVNEAREKYNNLLTEANKLKSENEEFKKALKVFKGQLEKSVVFNRNLAYTTKLFMEHATTKAEKENIIQRFDAITDLMESKKLYKTIANELNTRMPIIETVENRMIKGFTSSASTKLNESTAYVDPATQKILDLMNRVNKK